MIEWLEHFRLKNETPKIGAVGRIPLNTGDRPRPTAHFQGHLLFLRIDYNGDT